MICRGRASSLPAAHNVERRLPSVRERSGGVGAVRQGAGACSLCEGIRRSRERGTPAGCPKPEEPDECRAVRRGPSSATARHRGGDHPAGGGPSSSASGNRNFFFPLSPLSSLSLLLPSPFLSPRLSYPQVPAGSRERSPPEGRGGEKSAVSRVPPGLRGAMGVCGEWGGAERRGNEE